MSLYEKGRCARCSLRGRARELLADPAGTVPPALASVVEAITATRQPRVALNWVRQGAGAALLADVAAGRLPLTHEALDACPRHKAADYLRRVLTASGALPQRDEHLARTGRWLQGHLTGIEPPEHRRLVQAYATWQVMRRLRSSANAEKAVAGKVPVKRNRFSQLSGGARSVNRELEAKARALAGLKGYVTNPRACPDGTLVTADFVIGAYHRLFEIEKSFRMSKHDLQARPIYHHQRESIEPTCRSCSPP